MSYELLKPYTDNDYADFIVKYSHNAGLNIIHTDNAVYALEKNPFCIVSFAPDRSKRDRGRY